MKYQEQTIDSADGIRLFVRSASMEIPPRGVAVLTHGRGEHSGRYGHVVEAFAAHGVRVWSYDLRGHGRSTGPRGDLPSYEALLDDLGGVVACARAESLPIFLLGHSLGGQITLNFLLNRSGKFHGAVVASPYLRLAFAPPRWRLALAHAARWIWPSLTQPTPMPWSRLSRDEAHLGSFPDMDLLHDQISARMFYAIKTGAAAAHLGAERLRSPLLLLHGGDDPVTSVEATREFYERAGSADKTLKIFPEMLHETHNEIGRERVFREVITWIESRLGAEVSGGRTSISTFEPKA